MFLLASSRGTSLVKWGLCLLLLSLSVLHPSAHPADFRDDFDSFSSVDWVDPGFFGPSGGIDRRFTFRGMPDELFTQRLDGRSVLRMTSIMNDFERKAIATRELFRYKTGRIELRFKTLPRTDADVPADNQENIDGLLELWLVNPRSLESLSVRFFGGNFGENRLASIRSSLAGGEGISHPAWEYDTWYRVVINSTSGSTHVSFQSDGGEELFGHTYAFSMCELGRFQVALAQMMGSPGVESYADSAVDYIDIEEEAVCERNLCTVRGRTFPHFYENTKPCLVIREKAETWWVWPRPLMRDPAQVIPGEFCKSSGFVCPRCPPQALSCPTAELVVKDIGQGSVRLSEAFSVTIHDSQGATIGKGQPLPNGDVRATFPAPRLADDDPEAGFFVALLPDQKQKASTTQPFPIKLDLRVTGKNANRYDADGNGRFSKAEVREAMRDWREGKLSDDALGAIIQTWHARPKAKPSKKDAGD